ncbi:protein PHR1-LIKE 2-like [Cynara cardunculus var. scolymus]|nr:protein PHR1-LIKE 2-like [Cynara cardunculus var. scolymus]
MLTGKPRYTHISDYKSLCVNFVELKEQLKSGLHLKPYEVQHRLQLRIGAQGKYLQSILEKACKALNDQTITTAGLEAAMEELSELAIKVANDCPLSVTPTPSLTQIATHTENEHPPNSTARLMDHSIDSCLTSTAPPVGLSSEAAALKKRQRAMFTQAEWMAANIG